MWISNTKLEKREFTSAAGKSYTAWELSGIKKGYDGAPDSEWSKKLFETDSATVIENGLQRPNISVVSFFRNAVKPEDTVNLKQVRNGKFWKIVELSIVGSDNPNKPMEYTPLESASDDTTPPWAE